MTIFLRDQKENDKVCIATVNFLVPFLKMHLYKMGSDGGLEVNWDHPQGRQHS
jgi:hypothetical protein